MKTYLLVRAVRSTNFVKHTFLKLGNYNRTDAVKLPDCSGGKEVLQFPPPLDGDVGQE